ncbi:biotin--[acetyl-CoA-carboxylase] ligase [Kordiimonas pumila]|uniref:biotin--[biotin carboxyl-carrier protein] ligase n=1 Tax=Kordiimonas pumila TaxID=2161677 RepID=A0ABV7D1T9_9PROT|nr:biotin--[acetyl-CoA-carboxylase] ligase [Kordiimonas pumila]
MPEGVGARFIPVCDSTNEEAARLASIKSAQPMWIVAGEQSKGRGRSGRNWVSGSGNLYTSLLFAPDLKLSDLAGLPFIISLAIRETFVTLGGLDGDIQCKWPNDILINGKKAAGVLIETSGVVGNTVGHIIVGIGMNLLHSPDTAQFPATNFFAHIGKKVDPREALTVLAANVKKRLDKWRVSDFKPIQQEWTDHAWGIGKPVQVRSIDETFSATLLHLAEDGGLKVKLVNGVERTIYAADIFPGFK